MAWAPKPPYSGGGGPSTLVSLSTTFSPLSAAGIAGCVTTGTESDSIGGFGMLCSGYRSGCIGFQLLVTCRFVLGVGSAGLGGCDVGGVSNRHEVADDAALACSMDMDTSAAILSELPGSLPTPSGTARMP